MTTRIWAATKKGVFTIERKTRGWGASQVRFLGDNAYDARRPARPLPPCSSQSRTFRVEDAPFPR